MIELKDVSAMGGRLTVRVFKAGKLVESFVDENLIVDGARGQMARLIAGDAEDRHITKIAFGTDGTAAQPGDSEITDAFVKELSGVSFPTANSACFEWELGVDENNGTAIIEFGLVCEDGTLFSRRVRALPINKADDISLEGSWEIAFEREPAPPSAPEDTEGTEET
jgi:hypothetical protein